MGCNGVQKYLTQSTVMEWMEKVEPYICRPLLRSIYMLCLLPLETKNVEDIHSAITVNFHKVITAGLQNMHP